MEKQVKLKYKCEVERIFVMDECKKKIVIFGGSGFLGQNLAQDLTEKNYDVCTVSRNSLKTNSTWKHVCWDAETVGGWVHELDGAVAIVNLVGRTVDCIKTPDHCDEILRSRVWSTQLIGEAVRQVQNPPPVWVQMSTAHIYGDPPETVCSEQLWLWIGTVCCASMGTGI